MFYLFANNSTRSGISKMPSIHQRLHESHTDRKRIGPHWLAWFLMQGYAKTPLKSGAKQAHTPRILILNTVLMELACLTT